MLDAQMVIEAALLLYGLVAFVVMQAVERGARAERGHPPVLALAGWGVMSFSAALFVLLSLYAAYVLATGIAPAPAFA